MRALVLGHSAENMGAAPTLLSRAGFKVDVVSDDKAMTRCRNVNRFIHARKGGSVVTLANTRATRRHYELIVVGDDQTLAEILHAPLRDEEKARLLPVVAREDWVHIFSKIGLSKVLAAHGVSSPAFEVAQNGAELETIAREFGRPFVIKIDASVGGRGVFLCEAPGDVASYREKIVYPVLVQEWIDGKLIDLSGFFQGGEPIVFAYSEILESRPNAFGVSILRKYLRLADTDADCFACIEKLGKALGADGFVNIGCLRAKRDGKLYFIEADMRPNVWVEYPKFFGDDPAPRIADYFRNGITLTRTGQSADAEKQAFVLPYIGRMQPDEIAANKYDCLKYRSDYFRAPYRYLVLRRFWLKPLSELLLTVGRVGKVARLSAAGLALWHLMPPAGNRS